MRKTHATSFCLYIALSTWFNTNSLTIRFCHQTVNCPNKLLLIRQVQEYWICVGFKILIQTWKKNWGLQLLHVLYRIFRCYVFNWKYNGAMGVEVRSKQAQKRNFIVRFFPILLSRTLSLNTNTKVGRRLEEFKSIIFCTRYSVYCAVCPKCAWDVFLQDTTDMDSKVLMVSIVKVSLENRDRKELVHGFHDIFFPLKGLFKFVRSTLAWYYCERIWDYH